MAKWPRNICEDCKYKWNPRGHRLSAQCPKCKSSNIRIYRNWVGYFIALHAIIFVFVIFVNNNLSFADLLLSLRAKRGWPDPSNIDTNAYLWEIGKIFVQCAAVYLIPLSIIVFNSIRKKSPNTASTIESLRKVTQFNSSERSGSNRNIKNDSELMRWDVFISHASEDKNDFVRPLVNALKSRGLKVWYDKFSLRIGDSLRRSIDRGLANSRCGIVVISPNFLKKEWPQKELDGLVSLEQNERRVILPVWHNIDLQGVRRFSPILADRVAVSSSIGIEKTAKALADAMTFD